MKKLGLIGKNISYSFSKKYFSDKFSNENIQNFCYELFDIDTIDKITTVFSTPGLVGLNVTIPYKEQVIPYLDELSPQAQEIGAVNCIKIINNKKIGFNTDCYGFENSLAPLLKKYHKKALILGTGGASKAIVYVLEKLHLPYTIVSRKKNESTLTYEELSESVFKYNTIIINCTPLGTYPKIEEHPPLPYHFFSKEHLAYDLIYNPAESLFLQKAKKQGAETKNGLEMLQLQAEEAWRIWTLEQ